MKLLYTHTRDEILGNSIFQTFDFADDLPTSITITARAVTAIDDAGNDVTSTLIATSSFTNTTVTVKISTLNDEKNYVVTAKATGSDTKTYPQTLLLRVYNPSVFN